MDESSTTDRPPETPAEPPPASAAEGPGAFAGSWQLHRSVRDRKVKGVAGGVAAAAGLEPNLVRLLFAVAALSGWGIVAYIALAIVLRDEAPADPARPLVGEQRRILRIGLAIASVVAVGRLFDGWFFGGGDGIGLPLGLIALGAVLLWARRDRTGSAPGWDPAVATGPPGPGVAAGSVRAAGAPAEQGQAPPWPVGPPPPPGAATSWRSTGGDLLRLAGAFVAVGAILALLAASFLVLVGAVPMRLPFLPAALAAAAVVGLIVAVVRRSSPARLLLPVGALVLSLAVAGGLTSFSGGAGERTVTISAANPLLDRYDHDAGHLVLDLAALPPAPGQTRRLTAGVGAGKLTVIVPRTTTATNVRARAGAGSASLFGRESSGPGLDITDSQAGVGDGGTLDLDLKVGIGEIKLVLPEEPTFRVSCSVPEDALNSESDPVTCPHPPGLAATAMTCSVVLADPGGRSAGQGFCRRVGAPAPPVAGAFASACTVPSDADVGSCTGLTAVQRSRLQVAPTPTPTQPAAPAPPGSEPGGLTCGPPDADGAMTCTAAPAASTTTTTVPATYRCITEPDARQLTCVPIAR